MLDTGLVTCAAEDSYQRLRPFVLQKEATCAMAEEAARVKDGSYPSGHAAIGWDWALLLAEFGAAKAELSAEPWPAASGGAPFNRPEFAAGSARPCGPSACAC